MTQAPLPASSLNGSPAKTAFGDAPTTKTEHLVLTPRAISNRLGWLQRSGEARLLLADTVCRGLRLTLFASSIGTWNYSYRPRGLDAEGQRRPKRTLRLGDLASMTPAEARLEAEKVKAGVRVGRDPAIEQRAEKEAERLARVRGISCTDAAAVYIGRRGNDTTHLRNDNCQLRLALAEMMVERTACEAITTADLRRLLELHEGRSATARARLGAVQRFLDDCAERAIVAVNVARQLPRRVLPGHSPPRTRVYSAAETKALWAATATLGGVRGDYLRFLLLSPLRRQEAADVIVGHYVRSSGSVVLPGLLTKNGDDFTLPLSSAAREIVERRAQGLARSDRLFSLQSNGKLMTSWMRYVEAIRKASGIADFNFHDLRRTFMSIMAEHDAAPIDVLDALLNHRQSATVSGVRAAYLHARLAPQKAAAMAKWGEIVAHAVVHGTWPMNTEDAVGNVVTLRR